MSAVARRRQASPRGHRVQREYGELAWLAVFMFLAVGGPGASATQVASGPLRAAPARQGLAPPAARTADTKKGVDVWSFPGVDQALSASGATWYLTWSTDHAGITTRSGVHFVPMVWGAASVTREALAEAERNGPALLTFNEPDLSSQADMSVAQALALWPKLMATGLTLASPAVATGAARPGGWLDQFMRGAAQRHYQVDFIAVHWYGGDFSTGAAVAELRSYLESIHRRYALPVWLTEYSLIDFTPSGSRYPSGAQQAEFVSASARMLDSLSFVARYAWFALPATGSHPSTGLYAPGARPSTAGNAFARS